MVILPKTKAAVHVCTAAFLVMFHECNPCWDGLVVLGGIVKGLVSVRNRKVSDRQRWDVGHRTSSFPEATGLPSAASQ